MSDPDIGAWLRRQLALNDLTAAELARQIGTSTGRISEWMNGKYNPSPSSSLRLAEQFGADPNTVLALAGHRPPPPPRDDSKDRLIALIQRVEMTSTQIAGLEAMINTWAKSQHKAGDASPDQPE